MFRPVFLFQWKLRQQWIKQHISRDISGPLKGVHPKMKILTSFTHPHVVPNLYEFLSSVEHKIRSFLRMLETRELVAIDFHSIFPTMEVNGCLLTQMKMRLWGIDVGLSTVYSSQWHTALTFAVLVCILCHKMALCFFMKSQTCKSLFKHAVGILNQKLNQFWQPIKAKSLLD